MCTGTPVHYKQTVRLSCSGDSCFIKRRPCPDRGRGRLHGVAHSGQERRVGPGALRGRRVAGAAHHVGAAAQRHGQHHGVPRAGVGITQRADDVLLRLRQAAPDGLLEVGAGQQPALEREGFELPRGRAVGGGGEDGDQRPWAYTRPLLSST